MTQVLYHYNGKIIYERETQLKRRDDMFCYQCQETAAGKGCTKRGVCGKEDTTANLQDLTIFTLNFH